NLPNNGKTLWGFVDPVFGIAASRPHNRSLESITICHCSTLWYWRRLNVFPAPGRSGAVDHVVLREHHETCKTLSKSIQNTRLIALRCVFVDNLVIAILLLTNHN